jgi:hypothetical protein
MAKYGAKLIHVSRHGAGFVDFLPTALRKQIERTVAFVSGKMGVAYDCGGSQLAPSVNAVNATVHC